MSKCYLTKEEKLTLENNVLKENNLQMQINLLQNERQGFIRAYCDKNSLLAEEITNVNIQDGYIEFIDIVEEINNK